VIHELKANEVIRILIGLKRNLDPDPALKVNADPFPTVKAKTDPYPGFFMTNIFRPPIRTFSFKSKHAAHFKTY